MPEIDFDTGNSDLRIGLEIEFPQFDPDQDEMFVSRGRRSNDLETEVRRGDTQWPSHLNSRPVYDGTVGLEIVSNVLDLDDAQNWYHEILDHMEAEYNAHYQPTGLLRGGSTAGTHTHISALSESQARTLAEWSAEPWMQVLFCSSIATESDSVAWPVFRGGNYVRMSYGGGHYNVVNSRGDGHYEWRLPEPMTPEHVEILTTFLRIFEQDMDAAREYCLGLLNDGDERITSIRRAEAVGMDLDAMPAVVREQPSCDPESFYNTVASAWHYPNIYTVVVNDQPFYVFQSRLTGEFEVNGVRFTPDDVLYAGTLEAVNNDELRRNIRNTFNQRNEDSLRETEATEELKKIMKKKKEAN